MPESMVETGRRGRWLRKLGRQRTEDIRLEPEERKAIIASLFFEGSQRPAFLRRFFTLMFLSVVLAVLGLIADSTAVVIGAMLVAPLMAPVLAASAGLVMGWPQRIKRNLWLVGVASVGAVALAVGIGFFVRSELDPLPGEILARTRPNLFDLGIACAAGAAGAYSFVRRQASDALAGAAVAVALVPPLSVIGLTLSAGEFPMAGGATLLFLANVAGVLMSGAATFLVAGLVPGQRLLSSGSRIQDGLRWAAIATIIVILPLQFGQNRFLPPAADNESVEDVVDDWAEETGSQLETVDVGVAVEDGVAKVDLVVTTPDEDPPVEEIAQQISQELDQPVTVDVQVVETQRATATSDDKATTTSDDKATTTSDDKADVTSGDD